MSGFNNVYDGVEEFNAIMKKTLDLVEEAKSKVQSIDEVSFGEAATRVKAIDEICASARKQLNEAADTAEGILKLLRGG